MRFVDEERWPGLYALVRLFERRQRDYVTVFRNDNHLDQNFRAGAQRRVLLDLMRFCHAEANTHTDRQQGRREVWLYINSLLRLDPETQAVLQAGLSLEERYQLMNPEAATFIDGA